MALDEGGGAAPRKKKQRPVQGEQATGGSKVPVARPPRPVRAVRPVSAPSPRRSPGDQPGSSTRPVRPRTLAAFPGIEVSEGINWRGVNPRLVRALSSLAQDTGQTIYVTSGFRSYEKQAQLYEQLAGSGTPVAAPGTSNHEEGQAIDAVVNGQAIGDVFDEATLAQYGLFSLASINDPVHVELRRPGSYQPPTGQNVNSPVPHPSKTEGFGPSYYEDASIRGQWSEGQDYPWESGPGLGGGGIEDMDSVPAEPLGPLPYNPNLQPDEMQPMLADQTLIPMQQRADLWAQLAALPGASPETQALAQLAQAAVPDVRRRNPNSLRELERKSLLT